MLRLIQTIAGIFFITGCTAFGQTTDVLRSKLQQAVADKKAVVGVSIIGNGGKDTISLNGDRHCPLQSVFKFHIAIVMLSQVDKGLFSLDQSIEVKKDELLPGLWSPLREAHPEGGAFPISRLIEWSVAQSDNVACDVLLRLVGGPGVVETYFRKKGIRDIAIAINEATMQSKWALMFKNWTTPKAASQTLRYFFYRRPKLLSKKSYDFLWSTMKATQTGLNRLKAQLPAGTVVAHKTGSSGTNPEGLTAAVNDIGIVFLPDGNYFFISVFVTDSTEDEATNEKIIADIAKLAWDHYTTAGK